eukprot:TRINITY_DN2985_c0_g1_i1.p1 TRINITY_DN2985_c0_g1~~TRINITY_DN2985_c0_g1_i1.p1  ORF type:complete len:280 (+),score=81.14 TRINITY_DN2985_c0_g1_i1:329-1168(+)
MFATFSIGFTRSEMASKSQRISIWVTRSFHGLFEWCSLTIAVKEYWSMKQSLITTERFILKELGFILHVVHPHKFLLNYFNILGGDTEFKQIAWNYVNDSYRTDVMVKFSPESIAVAAIMLSARFLGIPLPENWWKLFEASWEDIHEIAVTIMQLYSHPIAKYFKVSDNRYLNERFDEEIDLTKSVEPEYPPTPERSPVMKKRSHDEERDKRGSDGDRRDRDRDEDRRDRNRDRNRRDDDRHRDDRRDRNRRDDDRDRHRDDRRDRDRRRDDRRDRRRD